jgi:hypothetical protein
MLQGLEKFSLAEFTENANVFAILIKRLTFPSIDAIPDATPCTWHGYDERR